MASRTNSSQPLPRKKVSASPLATPAARPPSPPPPLEPIPKPSAKKAKSKKQSQKVVKKPSGWFSDRVLLLFLGLFVVYALRVCPTDYGLQDPVCWGLAKYRAGVVDVYMAPPVKRVLEHPVVKVVVEKSAVVLKPVGRRAARGVEEAGAFVEPRYRAYVKPYVDPISRYAEAVEAYAGRVTPYVRRAYTTVSPYVRKAYTTISPYVRRAYEVGRPRVVAGYRVCVRRLGELRREFVDPHVVLLWVKVVELSRGRGETAVPPPSQAPTLFEVPVPTSSIAPTPTEAMPDPIPTTEQSDPVTSSDPEPASTESEQTEEVASTVIEQYVPTGTAEQTEDPVPTIAEDPAPTSTAEPTEESASTTAKEPVPTSSAEPAIEDPPSTPIVADEYDDFLADLGIDFDAASSSASTTATSTSFVPPTESSRDPSAIASKRANITARHASWAAQLDALAVARAATVRTNLSRIRSRAAAVLFGQAVEEEETDFVDGVHVSKLLDGFVDEAEKLVGGLEGWWKKEPKDEDRRERGEKVVGRVEEKLEALVREMGERVEKWATRVREDEVRECVVASREVKALAEKAQSDLGLDYAWLEDVTYEDWQRYHDLMRVYNEFDTQIRQIQNNTHVRPLGDTVLIALEAKQHDMQDAITGFVSRVARVREDMDKLKPNLDALLMGKSKEQVEQAFEQAEQAKDASPKSSSPSPSPSKRNVAGRKHGMPVAPQIPKAKKEQVTILPVGEPLVGEMTEEEVRRVKGDKRDPGEL
ncbi:uncharacterized protein EV420DRAFT_1643710 [Desarmillaria tabescens]|uniref:Uncharacterized protein n=1 Tax=Armillaria tabescens TaxID=1929756 RepID=A0AA39N570_ARMTA|nr:uncharacterized protein EV420DRAFT_1643710 [Desarmillaria tabescens]KAK0457863.1 hypothetical protein EV420DRAFT_1643710 [Desarmillaria tabescens]